MLNYLNATHCYNVILFVRIYDHRPLANYIEIKTIIIHHILLSNQSAHVAPGDFKIKSHIRTAARHTSLLIK